MKKVLLVLSALILSSSIASANHAGGFQDTTTPMVKKATVAEALKMSDNSYVTLQGNILKKLSDEDYLFKDATGTMTVEIDNNKWGGQSVGTNDKVEITGEIEKKFNSVKVDVDVVRKLN